MSSRMNSCLGVWYIHKNMERLNPEKLAEAHRKELEVQGKHGVKYLCEAPSKEAAQAVHREAHGGVADEVIEVKEGT